MQGLLDVNVLLALLDEDHVFHERAHDWFVQHRHYGWASCPLTENGLIRVRSNPNYHPLAPKTPTEMVAILAAFVAAGSHAFWSDDFSICDATAIRADSILGSRQVTDIYLLALAASHGGRLVTFDQSIHLAAVPAATPANLCIV